MGGAKREGGGRRGRGCVYLPSQSPIQERGESEHIPTIRLRPNAGRMGNLLNTGLIDSRFNIISSETPRVGGTAVVRKARDLVTDQFVAIKVLDLPKTDALARQVFEADVHHLKSMRHSNIVRYVAHGRTDSGDAYLATEWLPRSLTSYLALCPEERVTDPAQVLSLILPIAEALRYAHTFSPSPIEHRDIRPENIMFRDDGTPVLVDFGFSQSFEGLGISEKAIAPGMFRPPSLPSRLFVTDVYGLAATALRMIGGSAITNSDVMAEFLRSKLDHKLPVGRALFSLLNRCMLEDEDSITNGDQLTAELEIIFRTYKISRAGTRYLALNLSRSAVDDILNDLIGHPGTNDAEKKLLFEVNDGFHVDYAMTDGELDTNTLRICTSERIMFGKIDPRRATLEIVSARSGSYAKLESVRSNSLRIDGDIQISLGSNSDEERSSGLAAVRGRLTEFHAQKIEVKAEVVAPRGFFETQERTLQIREKLLDHGNGLVIVKEATVEGRNVSVVLSEEVQFDELPEYEEIDLYSSDRKTSVLSGSVQFQGLGEFQVRPRGRIGPLQDARFLGAAKSATMHSLRRQRAALDALNSGTCVNPVMAEALAEPSRLGLVPELEIETWHNHNLDDDKKEAIKVALASDSLVAIQGPPGTGKTQLIVELISQFLGSRPDGRVLLVSQTHVAVDNAVERLTSAGITALVRIARPDQELDSTVRPYWFDHRKVAWREQIRNAAQLFLTDELKDLGVDLSEIRSGVILGELRSNAEAELRVRRELSRAQERELGGSVKYSSLATREEEDKSSQDCLDDLALLASNRSRAFEQFSQLAPKWLDTTFVESELHNPVALQQFQDRILPESMRESKLIKLPETQGEWLDRLTTDDSILEYFLSTQSVVAGTAVGFLGLKHVTDLNFDLCIIDEASKATANELLVPISRSNSVVLVGDSAQLPPLSEVEKADSILQEFNLTRELFDRTLFEYLEAELPENRVRRLTHQYRMNRGIGDLISSCFYQGELKSPLDNRPSLIAAFSMPVCWINVEGDSAGGLETRGEQGFSYSNSRECEAAMSLLNELNAALVTGDETHTVLLVTPYAAQAQLLKRELTFQRIDRLDVKCLTIDQVQGREADIAIVSLVRSNSRGDIGFLREWRRLNVALSRGRHSLFIIGDYDFASQASGRLTAVADYVAQNEDSCERREVNYG